MQAIKGLNYLYANLFFSNFNFVILMDFFAWIDLFNQFFQVFLKFSKYKIISWLRFNFDLYYFQWLNYILKSNEISLDLMIKISQDIFLSLFIFNFWKKLKNLSLVVPRVELVLIDSLFYCDRWLLYVNDWFLSRVLTLGFYYFIRSTLVNLPIGTFINDAIYKKQSIFYQKILKFIGAFLFLKILIQVIRNRPKVINKSFILDWFCFNCILYLHIAIISILFLFNQNAFNLQVAYFRWISLTFLKEMAENN